MTDICNAFFELTESRSFIRLELMNSIYPNAELVWDRNWVKSNVSVRVGGFSGQFETDLRTNDFEKFKKDLVILYDKLDGTASFDTLEGQVNITIKGDGIGHFEAACVVMDKPGTGNTLEFELNFDQTSIPEILQQLDNISTKYPVLGKSNYE